MGVEVSMWIVEQVAGRVVDVEQDRVIGSATVLRIESHHACGGGEEVRAHQGDAAVGGQASRIWYQVALVPVDHRIGVFDNCQCPNPLGLQRFLSGIAEAETTN